MNSNSVRSKGLRCSPRTVVEQIGDVHGRWYQLEDGDEVIKVHMKVFFAVDRCSRDKFGGISYNKKQTG